MPGMPNLYVGGSQPKAEDLVANQDNADAPVNDKDDLLDQSNNSGMSLNVAAGGSFTLTAAQWTENYSFTLTGAAASAVTINTPASRRRVVFDNQCGLTVTTQVTGGGGASLAIADGVRQPVYCDATDHIADAASPSGPNLIETKATTSGTTVEFTTGISGRKHFKLLLSGVSANAASTNLEVQIRDNGTWVTTSYVGTSGITDAWEVNAMGGAAANVISGEAFITLTEDGTAEAFFRSQSVSSVPTVQNYAGYRVGTFTDIDGIRLQWSGGDTFDAGEASLYSLDL